MPSRPLSNYCVYSLLQRLLKMGSTVDTGKNQEDKKPVERRAMETFRNDCTKHKLTCSKLMVAYL